MRLRFGWIKALFHGHSDDIQPESRAPNSFFILNEMHRHDCLRHHPLSFFLLFVLVVSSVALAVHAPDASYPTYPAIRTDAQQTMSALPPQAAPVLTALKQLTGSNWSGYARNDGLFAWRVFGTGLHATFPSSADEAYRTSESILPTILHTVYGVPISMERLSANRGGGRWYVEYRQLINGIPVDGATISIRYTPQGNVPLLQLGVVDPRQVGLFTGIGEASASTLGATITGGTVEKVEPVWLLRDGNFTTGPKLQACYIVTANVSVDNRPVVYLDALTGAVVGGWNRVNFDVATGHVTGGVHLMYRADSLRYLPMEFDTVKLDNVPLMVDTSGYNHHTFSNNTPNLDTASAYLRGRYANVYPKRGNRAHSRRNGIDTVNIRFVPPGAGDTSNCRASEPNMFFHLNRIHDWYKVLDPGYTGPDYMVPGLVDSAGFANAFWDGNGTTFGDGGGQFDNFAMYSDVIYHEFTHGVTQFQYTNSTLPYSGESGAMNEGWSDYFACTFNGDPFMGEGGLMLSTAPMRDLTNNLRYPGAIDHEVHDDSRMFSGSLWRLRTRIGAAINDTLAHFTKYAHPQTFFDYLTDLLEHDDDDGNLANGTPHSPDIYWAFGDCHGIGPTSVPNLVISNIFMAFNGQFGSTGNGDAYFDNGETMSMSLQIKDSVLLYPPAATNVTLTFSCSDSNLTTPAPHTIPELNPRDSVNLGQLLFQNNAIGSHYVYIRYSLTADGGFSKSDSIKLLLGHPRFLVVSADTSVSNMQFVTNDLDLMNIGYYTARAGSGVDPITMLPDHDRVIWLGGRSQTVVTAAQAAALVTYLDRGGKLIMSAQNLLSIEQYPDLQQRLHFSIAIDSLFDMRHVDGVPGQPLALSQVRLVGAGGAYDQTAPDAIEPVGSAYTLYTYTEAPGTIAAIAYGDESNASSYRVVVCGFGVESICPGSNGYDLNDMLEPILSWFDGTLSAPQPRLAIPTQFGMNAYPNPFNSELRVNVTLPQAGTLSVALVDVLGRTVWSQSQPAGVGIHAVTIKSATLSSGMYFLKVNAPGNHTAMKKVTYLK